MSHQSIWQGNEEVPFPLGRRRTLWRRRPSGGGGPPAGGGSPGGALVPLALANQDVWPIGSPPSIFHGERALADNFLDELNLYFQVNWAVPNYQSFITCAAFALTYIKGEEVAGWVRDFGEFL